MSSFLSGAVVALLAAALTRAAASRRWRRRGPAHAVPLLGRVDATADRPEELGLGVSEDFVSPAVLQALGSIS